MAPRTFLLSAINRNPFCLDDKFSRWNIFPREIITPSSGLGKINLAFVTSAGCNRGNQQILAEHILIVNVHWGTEMTTVLEEAQKTMAREYIDAGADVIIGGHPHCLQGMDFYNNKPIIYSVGNFWFNSRTVDSCIITVEIDSEMNVTPKIVPLVQRNCESHMLTEYDERRALFDRVESYEPQGVKIADDGTITPAED